MINEVTKVTLELTLEKVVALLERDGYQVPRGLPEMSVSGGKWLYLDWTTKPVPVERASDDF